MHQHGWHLEWIWNFIPMSIWKYCINFVQFLIVFGSWLTFKNSYIIEVLSESNRVSLVVNFPNNGIVFSFPEIANQPIISCEHLLHIYITNLGLMSDNIQSYRESLLSLRLSSFCCVLYKPSYLVDLLKNGFNCMLNLGLHFLHVVEAYKIYTEFVTSKFVWNCHLFDLTLYIEHSLLLTSLSEGIMFIYHDSFRVYTNIGDASPFLNPV